MNDVGIIEKEIYGITIWNEKNFYTWSCNRRIYEKIRSKIDYNRPEKEKDWKISLRDNVGSVKVRWFIPQSLGRQIRKNFKRGRGWNNL